MKEFYSLITLFILIFISSCEYDSSFPEYEKELVVDGWIENGKQAKVLLTYSSPYISEVDSFSIRQYLASKAKVSVYTSNQSEILLFKPSDIYFPPNVYTSLFLTGETRKKYNLLIEIGGKEYTATTYIPEPPLVDSAWFERINSDTTAIIKVRLTDDVTTKDYYRIFTRNPKTDKLYRPAFVPNYTDDMFNGESITLPVYQGNETNLNREDQIYFDLSDSILVKVCRMDSAAYAFWSTFQSAYNNAGNPMAPGGRGIESNINGGLGIWCGYGANVVLCTD